MTRKNGFAYVLSMLCAAVLIFFTACKSNQNEPDNNKTETPTEKPQQTESLKGNVSRPANWNVGDEYDYTSSMTSIVRVDLKKQYPESALDFVLTADDLLGAFAEDGTCLGSVAPDEDGYFFLYIVGTEGDVTLRYWSGHYKNLFRAEPFTFVNDGQQGTYAEPFVPAFEVVK